MRLLLDTVTFLWLAEGDPKLSDRACRLIVDPANEVFLSAASASGRSRSVATPDDMIRKYPVRAVW